MKIRGALKTSTFVRFHASLAADVRQSNKQQKEKRNANR